MKGMVRRAIVMIIGVLMLGATAAAGNKKAITLTDLPGMAQKTVKANFGKRKVAMVKMETGFFEKTSYDVVFTNGDKIEFDGDGNWKEVSVKSGAVPSALVPQAVGVYLKSHYPRAKVMEMDKGTNKCEVKLSNGLEITFDNNYNVIEIDD